MLASFAGEIILSSESATSTISQKTTLQKPKTFPEGSGKAMTSILRGLPVVSTATLFSVN